MDDQFLSIKIKDGLFIGNKLTASDLEFLVANRFKYVLNCTSQVKNYFQTSNYIKYYKLKYSKNKSQQLLWKDNLKKLHKIVEFIEASEEEAECCLIHSNDGNNRCIVVAMAYMMVKYKWKLIKTLQFFEAKNIENKLSENYVRQLKMLEEMLSEDHILSLGWDKQHLEEEELLLTNTYLNSVEISFKKPVAVNKGERRVQWKDKLEKQEKIEKDKIKKALIKQESRKQKLERSEKQEKVQRLEKHEKSEKRMVKSQIIQVKKQYQKQSTRDTKDREKEKHSNRPSSSFTKNCTKKNKDEKLSEKGRQHQKQHEQIQAGDSSTEDRPHNNRLINNFVNIGEEPKRTSKMAPRKSEQNIKMIRAFSEKEYNSFKQTNKSNIPMNTSKQSLKTTKMKDSKTQAASKHYKSMQEGKIRAVSPKHNIRYKS